MSPSSSKYVLYRISGSQRGFSASQGAQNIVSHRLPTPYTGSANLKLLPKSLPQLPRLNLEAPEGYVTKQLKVRTIPNIRLPERFQRVSGRPEYSFPSPPYPIHRLCQPQTSSKEFASTVLLRPSAASGSHCAPNTLTEARGERPHPPRR